MQRNRNKKNLVKTASLWKNGEVFTAFDTETTGLNSLKDYVIEIGAVKFNCNGIIENYNSLIKPCISIPAIITKITGINDDTVSNSPCISVVLSDFLKFINGTKLIAHNIKFDCSFIDSECTRLLWPKLKKPNIPGIDTVYFSKCAFPELEKHNLQYLAKSLNINPGHAHRAYDDARVCKEIFELCCKRILEEKSNHEELSLDL
jgi:DNA polymerase-3 subunit epsilon